MELMISSLHWKNDVRKKQSKNWGEKNWEKMENRKPERKGRKTEKLRQNDSMSSMGLRKIGLVRKQISRPIAKTVLLMRKRPLAICVSKMIPFLQKKIKWNFRYEIDFAVHEITCLLYIEAHWICNLLWTEFLLVFQGWWRMFLLLYMLCALELKLLLSSMDMKLHILFGSIRL